MEAIEATRALCKQALIDQPLADAASRLSEHHMAGVHVIGVVREIASRKSSAELSRLRDLLTEAGLPPEQHLMERAFLLDAALQTIDGLSSAPLPDCVKKLWCKEIDQIAAPKPHTIADLGIEKPLFVDLCKILAGKRFPSGQHHWEISGFPRSWIVKLPPRELPRALRYLWSTGGASPFFETHSRYLRPGTPLLKRSFVAAFARMAMALPLQPQVRGLMASSWLYSAETARVSPHLSFFREAFLDAGGILIERGPAHENDGFLDGSPQRAELYRNNEYRPTHTVAICGRKQALAWLENHPEARQAAENLGI